MATANSRRNLDAEVNDLYQTSRVAMYSALHAGVFDGIQSIYDPCDGLGGISDILEESGCKVYRSDLIKYREETLTRDFLELTEKPNDAEVLVMNPPYKNNSEFLDKALELYDHVIMFNRINFLESMKRSPKLKSGEWPLAYIWFYGFRVGCEKGNSGQKGQNAVFYCWYEFRKNNKTTPSFDWITEKKESL